MFEIVFLGTSASAPSVHRGLSAQVILYRQYRFLIDCGEGTQRQLLKSGLGFKRLNRILLTHGHLDHILGLAGLLSTFMRWETAEKMDIYGGRHALDRVHDLLHRVVLRGLKPPIPLLLNEIRPGKLMEDELFELSAFPVVHRGAPGCFGYLFREKPRRPFLAEQAEALGVPQGPERKRLVNGQAISLSDGRTIQPDDVLGPEIKGTTLAVIGDAGRTDDLVTFVQGADALVVEATYLTLEEAMAIEYGHLTASQAAHLAQQAEVKHLILTHVSRRYHERDVLAEAQAVFPATVVARDFDRFSISREETKLVKPDFEGNFYSDEEASDVSA